MLDAKNETKDILRGFGRSNEAALSTLAEFDDWQRIARQELEQRATGIIQALGDDALQAIAAGTLDFRALCREVANELIRKAA